MLAGGGIFNVMYQQKNFVTYSAPRTGSGFQQILVPIKSLEKSSSPSSCQSSIYSQIFRRAQYSV